MGIITPVREAPRPDTNIFRMLCNQTQHTRRLTQTAHSSWKLTCINTQQKVAHHPIHCIQTLWLTKTFEAFLMIIIIIRALIYFHYLDNLTMKSTIMNETQIACQAFSTRFTRCHSPRCHHWLQWWGKCYSRQQARPGLSVQCRQQCPAWCTPLLDLQCRTLRHRNMRFTLCCYRQRQRLCLVI